MADGQVFSSAADPQMLQQIGDALDVGVLAVDKALVVTAWNRWLETATGRPAADVVGQDLCSLSPLLRASALPTFERAVNGVPAMMSQRLHGYLLDIPIRAAYGGIERMQQSVRLLPMIGADGASHGAVAFIQDVTERVAREEELRAAMEVAQEANRAKSDFLAAMSHELRTPIGAMLGYADLLADGMFGNVSDDQRDKLLRIKGVATHLSSVVGEILAFARLEAGRETANHQPVDARHLVRDAVLAVEPMLKQKGLTLEARLPGVPVEMNTDATKVRQILINLLGNAVKFTERGTITVEAIEERDAVSFSVSDSGPGIAKSELARIFEPFVQAEGAPRAGGTGLGLPVSRGLARLLGGDLTVASTPGVGSVFTARGLRDRASQLGGQRPVFGEDHRASRLHRTRSGVGARQSKRAGAGDASLVQSHSRFRGNAHFDGEARPRRRVRPVEAHGDHRRWRAVWPARRVCPARGPSRSCNLASLPHISVAGACATATHGSGERNGNLATAVRAMQLVTATGDVVDVSRATHGDQFDGMVVSLGALGIVATLTLDVVPAFEVRQDVYENLSMAQAAEHFDEIQAGGYSVSLFTDWTNERFTQVWVKRVVAAIDRAVDSSALPASLWLRREARRGRIVIRCRGISGGALHAADGCPGFLV